MLAGVLLLMALPYIYAETCPDPFGKCICTHGDYLGKKQFVLNCTDTGFTNASVLSHLPPQTQVLIFTGNNITELPWNVFGTTNDYSELRVVDMSNNNIQEIRGKSYHRVPKVERLILNHNQISISSTKGTNHHHPRVFSNFESLVELHLTDAFADNSPEDLAADLHDIFINSDLSRLRKLHLEQNEISHFKDQQLFCQLDDLMDLHLSDNKLTGVDFELDCLTRLRFIDLEGNEISSLMEHDLMALEALPQRGQNLTVDLSSNPLSCGCQLQPLYSWLQTTKVTVRRKEKLRCRREGLHEEVLSWTEGVCDSLGLKKATTTKVSVCSSRGADGSGLVAFLALCLALSLTALGFTNRAFILTKMAPIIHSLTRKVRYTNIGKQEAQEMDV